MRAARVIVAGEAAAPVVALDRPLSFWGGFDAETGRVIDEHHPQVGTELSGKMVVMATGRGSSSASSVLTESVRSGTAPAGFVLREPDEILATGLVVADELYGRAVPVVIVDDATYTAVAAATALTIAPDGTLTPH